MDREKLTMNSEGREKMEDKIPVKYAYGQVTIKGPFFKSTSKQFKNFLLAQRERFYKDTMEFAEKQIEQLFRKEE